MNSALSVQNLVKVFANGVRAVNDVSFDIRPGQCFGMLGPNGAGKTTTVEIMEGLCKPTSGQVTYRGRPQDKQFKHEIGILFQSTALQDHLTVRETLNLFSRLYSLRADLQELIDVCNLGEFIDRDASQLSGGQRQRLLLAIALVNDPKIIFLDEPTTGLDPQARRNFWALINSIKARNKTVVLTTHYMDEAYELCDEIIIMDSGSIIAQGTPKNLLAEHFEDMFLRLPKTAIQQPLSALGLETIDYPDHVEICTNEIESTIQQLLKHQIPLNGLEIRARTLEDLFLELTDQPAGAA